MKKYDTKDLDEAISLIASLRTSNVVLFDFLETMKSESKKQLGSKFEKASDSYLRKLKDSDVFTRRLEDGEYGYYPGMYGLFEKKTKKLLRRHTDTGFLNLPQVREKIGK